MNEISHVELLKKWESVLDAPNVAPIKDYTRRVHTALLMENTMSAIREERKAGVAMGFINENSISGTGSGFTGSTGADNGPTAGYDPILISLLRRNAPVLMAYDLCGVQPMSGPSGLIFAARSTYGGNKTWAASNNEALYNEANTWYGGNTAGASAAAGSANLNYNIANLSFANNQGSNVGATGFANNTAYFEENTMLEMGFSIEKVQALAKTRGLRSNYTLELAQDLKAVHGLEAEAELSNIISSELLAEINREIVRTIYVSAVKGVGGVGASNIASLVGSSTFYTDKYKALNFLIEKELNQIERDTRLGKGNILIVSADAGSALSLTGKLDFNNASPNAGINVPDAYNQGTYLGLLNGRTKVYADPYSVAGADYFVAGLKGDNYKVGLIYAPYVPLQMVRAVDFTTMEPAIGFKTRYALVSNPYSTGNVPSGGAITQNTNQFYRKVQIIGL